MFSAAHFYFHQLKVMQNSSSADLLPPGNLSGSELLTNLWHRYQFVKTELWKGSDD